MPRHDAVRTLEIYRKSESQVHIFMPECQYVILIPLVLLSNTIQLSCMLLQADSLTSLFEICRGLDFGRGQKYIKIEKVYEGTF